MARLPIAIAVTVLLALTVNISCASKAKHKRDVVQIVETNNIYAWICNNSMNPQQLPFCHTTTTMTTTTTSTSTTASSSGSDSTDSTVSTTTTTTTQTSTTARSTSSSTTLSFSELQRAHWCSFYNGSYVPLEYTWMQSACTLCQCSQTHEILCTVLQCMATYCIDASPPLLRNGQCCAECRYDPQPAPCVISGVNFPHGSILKSTSDNVQCWCEFGNVECRKTGVVNTVAANNMLGQNTQTYIIIVIICVVVIFASLLCCGCVTFYYFYNQNKQQTMQEAYEQYYNNAGWQAMGEDGVIIGDDGQEKQAEADQSQFEQQEYPTGNSPEYIPPPYALYNGTYPTEDDQKDPKYV
jgi:type II secretory pathway pseudopilin PulG